MRRDGPQKLAESPHDDPPPDPAGIDDEPRGAGRLGAGPATGLTVPGDFQMLSAWFDGINRTREQLAVPALRHDLALAGLLLEWRSISKATAMQGARR